jgi:tight adherence protein C
MSDLVEYLPALFAAGAVCCFALALRASLARARVVQRLDDFVAPAIGVEAVFEGPSFRTRAVVPLVAWMARITGSLMPAGQRERTRVNLMLAGMPYTWQWTNFLAAKAALAVAAAGLTLLVAVRTDVPPLQIALLALSGGAAGYYLPGVWLGRKITRRQGQILRALPDALDLLSISVSAGLGLEAAMLEVVQRWKNSLTDELSAVLRDLKLGTSRAAALREFARRTGLDEVKEFTVAVIQADELGMPLKDVLQIQAEQIRLRRRHRAEEQARKATIKMLVPMVFLVFPALVIVLLGPALPSLRVLLTGAGR